jgi:hypothetical protein
VECRSTINSIALNGSENLPLCLVLCEFIGNFGSSSRDGRKASFPGVYLGQCRLRIVCAFDRRRQIDIHYSRKFQYFKFANLIIGSVWHFFSCFAMVTALQSTPIQQIPTEIRNIGRPAGDSLPMWVKNELQRLSLLFLEQIGQLCDAGSITIRWPAIVFIVIWQNLYAIFRQWITGTRAISYLFVYFKYKLIRILDNWLNCFRRIIDFWQVYVNHFVTVV